MSKTDDFDQFLKNSFEKSDYNIADDGFTEGVISNLPENRIFLRNRIFILYLTSLLSVLIFFISSGYKSLLYAAIDIFNNGFHSISPSFNSIFVIVALVSVSVVISRIEYNDNLI
jgi:hypothetical protein